MTPRRLCFSLLVCLVFVAPWLHAQREYFTPDQLDYIDKKWPGTKKTSTGIRYIVREPGTGEPAQPGDKVGVTYVGMLLHGEKFDEKLDPKDPLVFRVDRGEVIPGWDQILQMMKVHEKLLAIIPGELGYGSRGRAPTIPRDAVLVFEMELVSIDRPQ